jgi:chlorite dismutase
MAHEAPYTLEGAYALHQYFRVNWPAWRATPQAERQALRQAAIEALAPLCQPSRGGLFRVLGHKADLGLVHLRRRPEELLEVEQVVCGLDLYRYLEPSWSYFSVVELSVHGAVDVHRSKLEGRGLEPDTPEWEEALEELLAAERERLAHRLFPELPQVRYHCFYPMNKRRGEHRNWYMLSNAERAELMKAHARTGRKYGGKVTQIISASTGLDDWEWGVDLFADDALLFKKLVYEMRFDEVSALYAEFGPFYVGVRTTPQELLA